MDKRPKDMSRGGGRGVWGKRIVLSFDVTNERQHEEGSSPLKPSPCFYASLSRYPSTVTSTVPSLKLA